MRWKWSLAIAALFSSATNAVFSDEAFHIDYHQALLGIPQSHATFFHKPQSSSNASLLYTISDKAVLGAVNPRDGSLVWRQALAGHPVESAIDTFLVGGDADGRITTGFGSVVSSWDALDGRLNWQHNFGTRFHVKGVQTVPSLAIQAENVVQDIIAVAGPSKDGTTASVIRLAADGAAARWEFQDKSASYDTVYAITTSPKYVYYITKSSGILSGSKSKVVVIDIATGKEANQYSVATDGEALGKGKSLTFGNGNEFAFMLSSEKPYKTLKFNLLGNSKTETITLEDKKEEIESLEVHYAGGSSTAPHFLVHVVGKTKNWAEVYHIKKSGEVTRAYGLPATQEASTFAVSSVGPAVYFARVSASEISLYSSESHGHVGRWPRSATLSQTEPQTLHACAEVSTRGVGDMALRVALSSDETGWSLIRNGAQTWSRPEMLAYITQAVWSDDAKEVYSAQEIEAEAASNPVSAYIHRLTRHVLDLRYLPQYLTGLTQAIFAPIDDTGKSTRERLIGSKLVLATTSRGEVFALDATRTAAVRWRTNLHKAGLPIPQARHLSVAEDRLTVYLSDGQFVVMNVANGQILDQQKSPKPFEKVVELPGQPGSTIIRISEAGKPEIFSELAPAVPTEGSVVVTVGSQGEAIGWSVGTSIEKLWTLKPNDGAKVTSVTARASLDPVASIGTVLGDRSVLYKYINPNVALVTALGPASMTVYVINAITGAILHTATHEGVLAGFPISATASGNKFTYSFSSGDFTGSGLTSQMVVCELYESEVPDDRGLLQSKSNYSSFSPDAGAKPYVLSKAFTIVEPISALTVSQTGQGITSRQILVYLANSRAIVGIPSQALDARRPVDRDPTTDEMEEGLVKYSPILDLDPKYFLSHSQDVYGVQKIMTAPSLLESTSLVFAFGHDIFGTQLAPSATFDVLGKGFKRIQLILTVVALYVGVLFIRPIARQKVVERRWA